MTDHLRLSSDDLDLLLAALDAYEYWELGDGLPRSNGAVFVPGDLGADDDPFWSGVEADAEQRAAIDAVLAVRRLADRLARALEAARPASTP